MITCVSCGAENESHYKFCLGCGAEIPQAGFKEQDAKTPIVSKNEDDSTLKGKLEAMRQRKLSDSPALIPSLSSPPRPAEPEEASFESLHTMVDQDVTTVEPLPSVIDGLSYDSNNAGVFGGADGSTALPPGHSTDGQGLGGADTIQVEESFKTSKAVSKDQTEVEIPPAGPSSKIGIKCLACGAHVVAGHRFCGTCGAPVSSPAAPKPESSPLLAELVFIHPSGEDGERLSITEPDSILGRNSPFGLLQSDPHLSTQHARLLFQDHVLYCEDMESYNGVFTRLKDETVLEHGGMFRIGQQLFLFEEQAERTPDRKAGSDQCITFGSPLGSAWGRLSSVCGPKIYSDQWILKTPEIYLGREKGTLTFPDDVFVSGTHCRLKYRDRVCLVEDLGSTNGTYIRRSGRFRLKPQDFILLGQQLFRVEIPN